MNKLYIISDCHGNIEGLPQIVGHTPRCVRMKGNALCIDVGAKDPDDNDPFILEIS